MLALECLGGSDGDTPSRASTMTAPLNERILLCILMIKLIMKGIRAISQMWGCKANLIKGSASSGACLKVIRW